MKLLQINSVCGYGSTGNIVLDLCHALEEKGHECRIAYGRGQAPADVRTYRIGTDADVYMHAARSRITDRQGFYSTGATKQFVKWMRDYNPDVIHLHNLHGYYLNIELLFGALRELDRPVIWTLHDCWAFTGHCAHFDHVGCDRWKSGCCHCPQKREYPASRFLDNSRRNYEEKKKAFCSLDNLTVVTPSEWLKGLVGESFLRKYPSHVIHNGIDLDVFRPTFQHVKEKNGLRDKRIVLGVANEWNRRKGLQDFARLSERLDDGWQVVLIGHVSGPPPKADRITYIGRTGDRAELAAWYTAANVFFNPTYEDNYPTVNLEAQACGTPVVTYDTGGSPEGVGYGRTVAQGNLPEVLRIIGKMDFPRAPVDVGAFSKEEMLAEYAAIYRMQEDAGAAGKPAMKGG